jgi:hypothetical protein
MTRSLFQRASVLVALAWPRPAGAHGGTWRADQILVDPGDPRHVVVASDVWGYAETHDGAIWQWFCAETYGGDSLNVARLSMTLLPGGDLLVANKFRGLRRSRGTLCGLEAVPFFAEAGGTCGVGNCLVADVAAAPGPTASVIVLTITPDPAGGLLNRLWRSVDAESWAAMPDAVPTDVGAANVVVAPTDSSRLYLTAVAVDDQRPLLLASSDGGASWARSSVAVPPLSDPREPAATLTAYGVHPTDPNLVFLRLDVGDVPPATGHDRVLVSSDGGTAVTEVFEGAGNLPGFALSPDGATVQVGGKDDGLWSASLADVRSGVPRPFHQVSTASIWGLAWTPDGLLAGHDDFPKSPGVPFSLGLSDDGGTTFVPRMTVCALSPAACPADTPGGAQCPSVFEGAGNFQFDFQGARCQVPPPSGTSDSGAAAAPRRTIEPRGASCACCTTPAPRHGALTELSILIALASTMRRRQR